MPQPKTINVEFWRKKWEQSLWHKYMLSVYLAGRAGMSILVVGGSESKVVDFRGNKMYEVKYMTATDRLFGMGQQGRLVGRVFGRGPRQRLVIHTKAPLWLRNWARHQGVPILPKLDYATLSAHLMKEKLQNAT